MATVTIDGREFPFEGRPKLLQFCLDHGVELPHFCYHPAMSAPANCRQCLVEVGSPVIDRDTGKPAVDKDGVPVIRFFPKPMTSCSQDVTDGLVVKTHRSSDLIRRAQKDTLEFLLLNHPLDCPICDQAGNCPLQIQAYKYGPEGSRFEFRKVSKPKHVELGPRVVLDAERCINCTRCVRFTTEVSESHQLTIIERGVRNYPMSPPGTEFDEPYSMNVIDICPVGALTSKEARFGPRVWEMSSTPSIVTANAKGSNCYYWVKDNRIMKVTPRANPEVNTYWLADEDRSDYNKFNDNRASSPVIQGHPATWLEAHKRAASLLSVVDPDEIIFIGSTHASVEDNYLLCRFADSIGAEIPVYIPHVIPGKGDDWLITDDRSPNTNGCDRLGMRPIDGQLLKARIRSGSIKSLYVMQDDPVSAGVFSEEDLRDLSIILHPCHTYNRTLPIADVVLPAAMIVETVGTFVNIDGHAQRVRPAKSIRGVNRTLMMEIGKSRADRHGTPFDRWYNEDHLIDCQPGWETIPEIATKMGFELQYRGPKAIMEEIASTNAAFSGATYEAMGTAGVRLEDVGETV